MPLINGHEIPFLLARRAVLTPKRNGDKDHRARPAGSRQRLMVYRTAGNEGEVKHRCLHLDVRCIALHPDAKVSITAGV